MANVVIAAVVVIPTVVVAATLRLAGADQLQLAILDQADPGDDPGLDVADPSRLVENADHQVHPALGPG
jgi:hypothetical protein